eukprot:TRINITY_DN3600_c0_g1_i1.p1 TRINITY_DN3600_c0_g1~~TRINITY_DN3600_c0_g1_i1.p1  ORF type:complete len:591 (-),score=150.50 TRINITY_DN3600_c0_g1_i1:22-1794(-)
MYRNAKFSVIAKKAIALDDFQGISENSGELFTFKKGDELTVIGISEEGYAGTNGRDFARFPSHYVRILDPDECSTPPHRGTTPTKPAAPSVKKPSPLSQSMPITPSSGAKKALPLKAPPNIFNKQLPTTTAAATAGSVVPVEGGQKTPKEKPPVPPRSPRGASSYGLTADANDSTTTASQTTNTEVVLTPKQKHRQEVIKEILTTEKDYVRDLFILTSVFLLPLRAIGVLPETDIAKLFSNVEVFTNVNAQMLEQLEARVASAPPTGACVGDVFKLMSNFLKMYNNYCANYPSAIAFLSVLEKNTAFKHFLDICQSDDRCKGLTLNAYLIKPVQRICKYPLLLKELVADTEPDHPDYDALVEAQKKVSEVANFINEETRKSERSQKLLEIQSTVDGCIPLVEPARRFCREGVFKSGNDQKPVKMFLFNDLVLIAAEKNFVFMRGSGLEYKTSFLLHTSRLVVVADTDEIANAFAIQEEGNRKNSIVLCSPTSTERDSWVKEMKALIKEIQKKKIMELKGTLTGSIAVRSPRAEKPSVFALQAAMATGNHSSVHQSTSGDEEQVVSRPRHIRRRSTGSDGMIPKPLFMSKQ